MESRVYPLLSESECLKKLGPKPTKTTLFCPRDSESYIIHLHLLTRDFILWLLNPKKKLQHVLRSSQAGTSAVVLQSATATATFAGSDICLPFFPSFKLSLSGAAPPLRSLSSAAPPPRSLLLQSHQSQSRRYMCSNYSILHLIIPMVDKRMKKRLKTMVEPNKDGKMSLEDVAWLCSLSESEIDMLISLKFMINQRAKMIGYANLANKFDLKMIRAIAFVLMEQVKEEVTDSPLVSDMVKYASFLDSCNLLNCDNEVATTIEELSTNIGADIQTLLNSSPTSKRKKKNEYR